MGRRNRQSSSDITTPFTSTWCLNHYGKRLIHKEGTELAQCCNNLGRQKQQRSSAHQVTFGALVFSHLEVHDPLGNRTEMHYITSSLNNKRQYGVEGGQKKPETVCMNG